MGGRESPGARRFTVEPLDLPQMREIYLSRMVEDFPENELKPLALIESGMRRGFYRCWGAADGSGTLAYACFVCVERDARALCLFDYLAVRRDVRGEGVGSAFLQALSGAQLRAFDAVLLEVDDPSAVPPGAERGIRERRLRFYLRNGLVETGVTARVFGAEFRLLALPGRTPPDADAVRGDYAALYRAMLPARLFRREILIR